MFFNNKQERKWHVEVSTDKGRFREINQDNVFFQKPILRSEKLSSFEYTCTVKNALLCAVCDGMGGESRGEEASFLAVDMLQKINPLLLQKKDEDGLVTFLTGYLQTINDAIYRTLAEGSRMSGCTISLAYVDDRKTILLNVGDSSGIYVNRNEIRIVTIADNKANQLYRMGRISEEERWTHASKSQLTQYLGMNPAEILLSPHVFIGPAIEQGEHLVLASDGLHEGLSMQDIKMIVSDGKPNHASKLVHSAIEKGCRDNVTAIVITREK